jgi:hypothetical protein
MSAIFSNRCTDKTGYIDPCVWRNAAVFSKTVNPRYGNQEFRIREF